MNQVQIEAIAAIEKQQTGLKRNTVWMVGEQLKDICRREESSAQLILEDLKNEDMSIAAAEKKIAAQAQKNRVGSCGCVSPYEAEEILREFYGLGVPTDGEPAAAEEMDQRPKRDDKLIDLADFF